jgi:hypothetical protein
LTIALIIIDGFAGFTLSITKERVGDRLRGIIEISFGSWGNAGTIIKTRRFKDFN